MYINTSITVIIKMINNAMLASCYKKQISLGELSRWLYILMTSTKMAGWANKYEKKLWLEANHS